jgi:hypothetical protein
MANAPTPPAPGGMTVSFLHGWGDVATVLAVLVVVAVAFLVFTAAGPAVTGRAEWQAWLDARSSGRRPAAADPTAEPTAEPVDGGRTSGESQLPG